ncbi:MAG: hypothetical protein RMI34_13025 [Chloroherpetonaceae bacterium]|nr:hypothetical protein [Chloroherpetonaceae bacterium]MCS7210537.1 hypothetical protein [Chloroherpetonaceae bacterium]MDW8020980.1 hypothetical protein [Chloroherpetonaceae bacterium]MDW8467181.1 hypothetical protein [Chloroherpetonaceae bacterium]
MKRLALLLACLCLLSGAECLFAQSTRQPSVREILNPDGTLRLDRDGGYSLEGFSLQLDAQGRPMVKPKAEAETQSGTGSWGTGSANGVNSTVNALAAYGGSLFVGGVFTVANVTIPSASIARWTIPSTANALKWRWFAEGV